MWTKQWWKDATERAVKSAAQAVVLSWALGDQMLDLWSVDWKAAVGFAGGGALLSYLTSIVSMVRGDSNSASMVDTTPDLPHLTSDELRRMANKAAAREAVERAR